MRATALRLYPVKSMAGVDVGAARVEPWGLAGDRRWALVDTAGASVTAREVHELLGLSAEPVGGRPADWPAVRISDRAGAQIVVEAPLGAAPVPVGLSRQGSALPADGEASEWLSKRLGLDVRLVWQDDPTLRSIDPAEGGLSGETLSLADAGPLLLVTEASMRRLNEWIAADAALPDVEGIQPSDLSGDGLVGNGVSPELSIVRFRPNVVLDGDEPFAEDDWSRLRIGDVEFRTTAACDRCVMTTVDPVTLRGGKEPIRTLARHRRRDAKTWFGIRLAPLGTGKITVGDEALVTS
jgi:MOSC domain-containing protein